MLHHVKNLSGKESVALFKALGSSTRVRIVELLSQRELNINELSAELGLTQPSVTKHVQILEEAGVIASDYIAAPQGTQKRCRCVFERLMIDFTPKTPESDGFAESELPIGMYSDVNIVPTCGIATRDKFIGLVDSPLSFYLPERSQAEILWAAGGWVEYAFTNTLAGGVRIKSMEIAMELSSEAPGYDNNFPSDISVWINGVEIGTYMSPGDFGGTRGMLNPVWYPDSMNQWGVLKTFRVDQSGTSVDGVSLSDVKIDDLNILPWQVTRVRIGVKEDAENQGGFTLFGRGFGNYQMGLVFRLRHERSSSSLRLT